MEEPLVIKFEQIAASKGLNKAEALRMLVTKWVKENECIDKNNS